MQHRQGGGLARRMLGGREREHIAVGDSTLCAVAHPTKEEEHDHPAEKDHLQVWWKCARADECRKRVHLVAPHVLN